MKFYKSFRYIWVIFLFSDLFSDSLDNSKFANPISFFSIFTPSIQHPTDNLENGISVTFSYPGFFSYIGQANVSYSTTKGNSFYFGIGGFTLMTGLNYKLYEKENNWYHLNMSLGFGGEYRYSGSIGLSLLSQINSDERVGFNFDLFYHQGMEGDMFMPNFPMSKGIVLGLNYSFDLSSTLSISLNTGLSFLQYRYMADYNWNGELIQYEYVSWKREKHTLYLENPKWESRFIIPFGITINFN